MANFCFRGKSMENNGGTNLRKYEREDFGWTLCGTPLDIFDTHSYTIYSIYTVLCPSPHLYTVRSSQRNILYSRDTFHFHFLYFLRWVLCLGLTCSVKSIRKWIRKVKSPMTIIRKRRRKNRSPMTIIRKRKRKIRSPIFQPNNFDTFLHLSSPKNLPFICQLEKCVDMYRADIFVIFGSQLAAPLYKPLITLQTDR